MGWRTLLISVLWMTDIVIMSPEWAIHITRYGRVLSTPRDPVTATTSVPLHSPKQTKRDVVLKAERASALRQCRGS